MSALLNRNKMLITLLLYINVGIILSQEEKCTAITHCKKCPDQNKCEICEDGFKINEENKCIEITNNDNNGQNNQAASSPKKSSPAAQQNPPAGSQPPQQNPPAGSQPPHQSGAQQPQQNQPSGAQQPQQNQPSGAQQPQQNQPSGAQQPQQSNPPQNSANNPPKASNNPTPSNLGNNMSTNDEIESSGYNIFLKIIMFSIIFVFIIICIRWLFIIKKKNRTGYFYDESGRRGEKAKVVYIQ